MTHPLDEDGFFCVATERALIEFQASRGLRTDGLCDPSTWSALVEASWSLGDRMLYLTSPNFRGDDVAELQTLISKLGFDCGRVDGIFGPLLAHAIGEFQANAGLSVDGICSADTVVALKRLSSQSGVGPGVASLRESERLLLAFDDRKMHRVVVGQFGGLSGMARLVSRALRESHDIVTLVDEPDVAAHVKGANHFGADAYIGLEAHAESQCTLAYYSVPGYTSTGGQALAHAIAHEIETAVPALLVTCSGMRLPVLRETRMPAVLCSFGPFQTVVDHAPEIAGCISTAFSLWQHSLHSPQPYPQG